MMPTAHTVGDRLDSVTPPNFDNSLVDGDILMTDQPIWYFLTDDVICGPNSASEIKQLAKSGTILPTTLIRRGEVGKWIPAQTVRGLFDSTSQKRIQASTPITNHNPKNVEPSRGRRRAPTSFLHRNRWIVQFLSFGTPLFVLGFVIGFLVSLGYFRTKPNEMLALESETVLPNDNSSQLDDSVSMLTPASSIETSGDSKTHESRQNEFVPSSTPDEGGLRANQGNTPSVPTPLSPSRQFSGTGSYLRSPPFSLQDLIQVLGRPDEQRQNEALYSGILKIQTGSGVTSIEFNTGDPKALFFVAGIFSSKLFTQNESQQIIELSDKVGETDEIGRFKIHVSETDRGYGLPWRRIEILSR